MTTDPRLVFDRIGRAVDRAWQQANYDERAFPELAASVLAADPPEKQLDVRDLLRWVLDTPTLPQQLDPGSKFGQPPLTMYRAPRFLIDALFWMEGTTDIHQHGFCGAFHVLAGSSVHSQYRFSLGERVNAAMLLGEVAFERFEILSVGDTRRIEAGSALIHGLFHLERPSVTIVIRTYRASEGGPQYLFHPPSLAVDPFFEDPLLQRRVEALGVLAEIDPALYELEARRIVADADLYTVYQIARHHLARAPSFDHVRVLLDAARGRHGTRVDTLAASLEETLRITAIMEKRRLLKTAEHRFFLALLMNLPTRATILAAVAQRYPEGDPCERVARWVDELATALVERDGGAAEHDHTPVVLAHVLRGHTGEALITELKHEFDDDDVERLREQIHAIERSLGTASLLRPLFR